MPMVRGCHNVVVHEDVDFSLVPDHARNMFRRVGYQGARSVYNALLQEFGVDAFRKASVCRMIDDLLYELGFPFEVSSRILASWFEDGALICADRRELVE